MVNKTYNRRQQLRIFKNNGFREERISGSHIILRNNNGDTIIISAHGKKMSDTAFNKTIKNFNLSTGGS